ncbi:MAG: bifunctional (p)ppGpp synthetase/guanosine-3',5'-bis(diphosphate) 3'-pyrophosphohydrolase [Deltaproteobacteria bacterium]|nr:bifunctional (p)ppGpp synthetase/guanosine-3',5'-bis(diphosphate) 3'-pyrophosphohydrolase [Deltaproteobacteria bacterium]
MIRLTDICEKVQSYHPAADVDLIHRAYVYSAKMHDGQTRKSGEPYLIHPLGVADVISELKLDAPSVCAALLHDVVEDTLATTDDIARLFGAEVAFLVDGVTKLSLINFNSKEDRQAENFRKMLVAMAKDIRVLLVKLADRLDNMRSLGHLAPEKQERIARETMEIYAPLANRLGISWLKCELEDLAFRYLEPDEHRALDTKVHKSQKERDRYIEDVVKVLQSRLAEPGFAAEVSGRAKHLYSIFRKMKAQQVEFEKVFDVIAFRIVVETVADCYAVLGVIHSRWTPIPGRFKDYIALPKPNMYQSLHTTVIGPKGERVEIQIRTRQMHRIAEDGIAAHWRYKDRGGYEAKDAEKFTWLRQLMELQRDMKDPAEFLETVKVDLFSDEVYVFTPKGEVRVFPRGATPVDFAFAIHSDLGIHCSGARVNGAIQPLRYKMRNGDTIDILTSNQQHPSKDWLDFVVTSRAKARIRSYIRLEQRERALTLGKELLERELHKHSLSLARIQKAGELEKAATEMRIGTADELLCAIGYGKASTQAVIDLLVPEERRSAPPTEFRESKVEQLIRKVTRKDQGGIKINGVDGILVRYARCCSPLPGDEITGFITRGRGVTVHRHSCPKAIDVDPDRRIEVSWDAKTRSSRPVSLRVITADRPGILATISTAFSQDGINISQATCKTGDADRAVNTFSFAVTDLGQLKAVIRHLQKIDGVISVDRV